LYYIFLVLLLSWKRGNIFCAPAYVRILWTLFDIFISSLHLPFLLIYLHAFCEQSLGFIYWHTSRQ
jgi:hypothetical protein